MGRWASAAVAVAAIALAAPATAAATPRISVENGAIRYVGDADNDEVDLFGVEEAGVGEERHRGGLGARAGRRQQQEATEQHGEKGEKCDGAIHRPAARGGGTLMPIRITKRGTHVW